MLQDVQGVMRLFAIVFKILPPLLGEHLFAIGCTENGQSIGVSVHSLTCRGWVEVNIYNVFSHYNSFHFPSSGPRIEKVVFIRKFNKVAEVE